MYLTYNCQDSLYNTVKHCLREINPTDEVHNSTDVNQIPEQQQQQGPPTKKRRKQAVRVVKVTSRDIFRLVGQDIATQLNCANPRHTLYTKFSEKLVMEGVIKWRQHNNEVDVCIMTDYNPTTGHLLPQSFVHVSATKCENGQPILRCTCAIYNLIERAANQDQDIWPNEHNIPDDSLTCMHCQFFNEHLMNAYEKLQQQNTNLSTALCMVQESLQYMNEEIQLLSSVLPHATTKFSVKGTFDSYSIVHINFHQHKCYAKCTEGMCAVSMHNRARIPKKVPVSHTEQLCVHMNTLYRKIDYIQSFFPEHFNAEENDTDEEDPTPGVVQTEEINLEDIDIGTKLSGNFDTETGLWNYKCVSENKPANMMDPQLIINTEERNKYINAKNMNENTGLYGTYEVKPTVIDANGREIKCQCGSQFSNESSTIFQGSGILYTCMGPIETNYYNILCEANQCTLEFTEEAEKKNIFMYMKSTACGDEIGWDFIHNVMKTKMSFTGFCNEMTRKYQTNNIMACPFMSPKTFINWLFGWLAAFKIDFRQSIDPWCKHSPQILAGDGTHIGVSVRNMKLAHPVNSADDGRCLKAIHRWYDRVLMPKKCHRLHMRYLANKYLKKIKPNEYMDMDQEATKTHEMLQYAGTKYGQEVNSFLLCFAQKTEEHEVLHCMACILHMLSGDGAISTVVPFGCHEVLLSTCEDIESNIPVHGKLEELKHWGTDISHLLKIGIVHDVSGMMVAFCRYLVQHVIAMHSRNRNPPDPTPIPNSYKPAEGTAYYFTPSGQQLRKMPSYDIDGNTKYNYDDRPEVEDPCTKNYPSVSFGGFGYLFLWFCPVHGHSYGFHLIAGGRDAKILLVLYSSTWRKLPSIFIMIMLVNYQSIASIGNQNSSNTQDSGMTCSTALDISVD